MNKFLDYCTNTNLHATVILPGYCNAKCPFCYDLPQCDKNPNYINDLKAAIKRVPEDVRKFAVTGMETSISPHFNELLDLAIEYRNNKRFDFMFLNTNGFKLDMYGDKIGKAFDAINISRHAADDEENYKIFGTRTVPSLEELKALIPKLKLESGVNINTVVTDDLTTEDKLTKIYEMVKACKYIGANSLTVRFEATDRLRTEKLIPELDALETIQYNANPGCRFWLKKIDGLYVVLKFVTKEPTSYSDWNYGYIVQRNLDITRDWAGKKAWNV